MMKKRNLLLGAFAIAAIGLMNAPAMAVTCDTGCSFKFTSSANSDVVTGFFTTVGNNISTFGGLVTGSSDPGPITALEPAPAFTPPGSGGNYYTVSNTFDGSTFDGNGVVFAFGSANYGNIFDYLGSVYFSDWIPDGNTTGPQFLYGVPGSFEVAQTPLPPALLLFGSGVGLLGFVATKRRKKQAQGSNDYLPALAA